jgi:GLPGLI family protein
MSNFKDEIHYSDYKNKIFINHFEFQGKNYNIINNQSTDDWEITSETKLINEFLCYKVVKKDNKSPFPIIWLAPELNFPIGPFDFNNFPGMILEVNYKILTIFCDKIEFENENLHFGNIQEPKGILMSYEDFKKIIETAKKGL